jgi:hypothetical protein
MGSFPGPLIPSCTEPRMPADDMLGGRLGTDYCFDKAEEASDMPGRVWDRR